MVIYRRAHVLLFFFLVVAGCTHRVDMRQLPPGSQDFLPSEVGLTVPAIIKTITLWVNGQEIVPKPQFYDLVLQTVRRTHVFRQVVLQEASRDMPMREKAVTLELTVNGSIDTNQTSNQVKLIANLATLFLFSSALPFKDDFDISTMLKVMRYDGKGKYYRSRIRGSISYRLLSGEQARQEAQERVIAALLNSLMHQIIGDIPFYLMKKTSRGEPFWKLHSHPVSISLRSSR